MVYPLGASFMPDTYVCDTTKQVALSKYLRNKCAHVYCIQYQRVALVPCGRLVPILEAVAHGIRMSAAAGVIVCLGWFLSLRLPQVRGSALKFAKRDG